MRKLATIIDISRELSEGTEVYPGDQPFVREQTCAVSKGDATNVSAVRGSSHAATHIDHPSHLYEGAAEPRLETFVGPTIVVERIDRLANVAPNMRVLIKGEHPLEPDDVDFLIGRGVVLVGVETMSVDALDSNDLPNHHKLLSAGIAILESLDLTDASPGVYELIALPLKIPNADATWVRAVLRK